MKRIAVLLMAAAVSVQAFAQGTVMDFIRADRNPVTLGSAGAGYASPESGTALAALSNPAAVALSAGKLDAAGVFGMVPAGSSHSTVFGGGASIKFGSFGVSLAYLGGSYPKVPLSSDGGGASGNASPSEMTIGLGLSYAIGDFLSFGALARYASGTLDAKTTLTSFSADVMALYRMDALSIGAGVAGLGPKVSSIGNRSYSLPASARLGAACKLGFGDFGLDLRLDGDYYFIGNFSAAAGLQADFRDMVFLRTGYRFTGAPRDFAAAPVPSFFSVGAGVKLFGVSLNAAYLMGEGAGGTFVAGLGYSF